MNHQGLLWNVHCIATVVRRNQFNFKSAVKRSERSSCSLGWTRLSRLKIHFHTENKTGLQRLPCFSIRTRHRTFMNLTGKIIQSRNHCSNCNHYKRLSKRKLIKSKQSWLSSMLTERTPTSFTVIRCQNS